MILLPLQMCHECWFDWPAVCYAVLCSPKLCFDTLWWEMWRHDAVYLHLDLINLKCCDGDIGLVYCCQMLRDCVQQGCLQSKAILYSPDAQFMSMMSLQYFLWEWWAFCHAEYARADAAPSAENPKPKSTGKMTPLQVRHAMWMWQICWRRRLCDALLGFSFFWLMLKNIVACKVPLTIWHCVINIMKPENGLSYLRQVATWERKGFHRTLLAILQTLAVSSTLLWPCMMCRLTLLTMTQTMMASSTLLIPSMDSTRLASIGFCQSSPSLSSMVASPGSHRIPGMSPSPLAKPIDDDVCLESENCAQLPLYSNLWAWKKWLSVSCF